MNSKFHCHAPYARNLYKWQVINEIPEFDKQEFLRALAKFASDLERLKNKEHSE